MNDLELTQRQVDIYCEAIKKLCDPFGIEVINSYLSGNKVLVVKFNPSNEEKNRHEFERTQKLKDARHSNPQGAENP